MKESLRELLKTLETNSTYTSKFENNFQLLKLLGLELDIRTIEENGKFSGLELFFSADQGCGIPFSQNDLKSIILDILQRYEFQNIQVMAYDKLKNESIKFSGSLQRFRRLYNDRFINYFIIRGESGRSNYFKIFFPSPSRYISSILSPGIACPYYLTTHIKSKNIEDAIRIASDYTESTVKRLLEKIQES